MNKLIPFLLENWYFVALFVGLLLAYVVLEFKHKGFGVSALSTQRAVQLMNQKNTVLIDVREKSAYDQGHITGAVHCLVKDLGDKAGRLQTNRDEAVIVVCDTGHQSRQAANVLKKQGYNSVYTLQEGLGAWKKDHLPLVKS